jgi:hypothetical protein
VRLWVWVSNNWYEIVEVRGVGITLQKYQSFYRSLGYCTCMERAQ